MVVVSARWKLLIVTQFAKIVTLCAMSNVAAVYQAQYIVMVVRLQLTSWRIPVFHP